MKKHAKGRRSRVVKFVRSHCFVVYECCDYDAEVEGRIHGIYLNREEAEGKREKLMLTYACPGYIAILKKPLLGKDLLQTGEYQIKCQPINGGIKCQAR